MFKEDRRIIVLLIRERSTAMEMIVVVLLFIIAMAVAPWFIAVLAGLVAAYGLRTAQGLPELPVRSAGNGGLVHALRRAMLKFPTPS